MIMRNIQPLFTLLCAALLLFMGFTRAGATYNFGEYQQILVNLGVGYRF
jgi:hypothetical protein